ncbi:MAG: SDR family NAD(P)-dependent oxidoreductase, partial [Nocardioidaceae bacterium]
MPLALVTGPTAGIGRAFCDALAARGHDLVLVSRDEAKLEQIASQISLAHGVRTEPLAADLADLEQTQRVETRLRDQHFDLLVNNAGFGLQRPFAVNDIEAEQRALDVMVRAVMRLTHAAIGP